LRTVFITSCCEPDQGVTIDQRCRSLSGLNFASVGELLPTAESASGSFEFGTPFGITRYVPSVS
jgi:hypothetical protein